MGPSAERIAFQRKAVPGPMGIRVPFRVSFGGLCYRWARRALKGRRIIAIIGVASRDGWQTWLGRERGPTTIKIVRH